MVAINNIPHLYGLRSSLIYDPRLYGLLRGSNLLTHRNRTVITTYSTYIHTSYHHTIHATESCKETKRPPSSTTTTTSKTTTESCNETKRSPSSAITSERLNRLRLKRQVSVLLLAYIIGMLDQAICIAPFDPLGAGILTRMYESPVCS